MRPIRDERGQALPLVVVVLVLVVGVAMVLAQLAGLANDRATARTAADAAALAGASAGQRAAEDIAEANGARVEHYLHDGADVEVVVRVGRATAAARARAESAPVPRGVPVD